MMLRKGDKAIVINDDGGHFYKGKKVVILTVLPPYHNKPVLTKALHGVTESWYNEEDLQKVEDE